MFARQSSLGKNGCKSAVYHAVNEHFEAIFNDAATTQVINQRLLSIRRHVRLLPKNQRKVLLAGRTDSKTKNAVPTGRFSRY